ncbi:MAG: WG repeat-containing protein [Bacteroidales bacterium]|nr:WG repeat-containing protein [Bacteroidales bacterium]
MKKLLVISSILVFLTAFDVFSQTFVARVRPVNGDKWQYVGCNGKFLMTTQFSKCSEFSAEGLATIYDIDRDLYYIINMYGKIVPVNVKDIKFMTGWGQVPKGFSNGLLPVRQGKKWGYLDASGKVAIPLKYDKVTEFNGGFAVAVIRGKFMVLDSKGSEFPVNDASVVDVKFFTENLAPYESNKGRYGFINEKGETAIPAQFLAVGCFSGGLAWARATNEKIGYINTNGDWIIQPQFESAKNYDGETDRARIKLYGNVAFTNCMGEILYYDAEAFGDFSDGLCWGRKNGKIGYFNPKGEWIITPQYEAVWEFKNGFAAAKINDKWGIIDREGKWALPPVYGGITHVDRIEQVASGFSKNGNKE